MQPETKAATTGAMAAAGSPRENEYRAQVNHESGAQPKKFCKPKP